MEQKKNRNSDRRAPRRESRPSEEAREAENLLEGRNAVQEAIAAGRAIAERNSPTLVVPMTRPARKPQA